MPNQALPALSRCGVAVALLLTTAACGQEREPWYGFELFPDAEVPPDVTAGTEATSTAPSDSGSTPAATPDTSGGTAPPNTLPAAGSGGGTRGPTQPTTSPGGVQTGTPETPDVPGSAMPDAQPMSFRITELQLRDPHVFAGTTDITEQQVLGQSVNRTLIPDKLTKDADGDGAIDVSVVALLAPFDPSASPSIMPTLTFVNASCPINGGATGACKPLAGGLETTWMLEQRQSGNCLEPMQGTTSNYQPAIAVPSGPCFLSSEGNDLTMDLGGIKIDVTAARVSATYQAQPAGLVKGLLAGFVTRSAAEQATLPSVGGSMVGGDSLDMYVRMRDYDQSASPNGQDGFWMYLNFVAKPIAYTP